MFGAVERSLGNARPSRSDGRMLWMGGDETSEAPTVRDKGKIQSSQVAHWIIPSDGITLVDPSAP